ncbi:MAG: ATP synthase F1 subunit epsilon [Candidatus Magasanikbacteria bacterium CG10_big_fil_rev_8_21_14_0_10_36_16]|uniref:ATP synthase epsilon chain n=1 Tax=Candidatus Magasanikbacteria bacterium CG10_big_fil_rev_8_21_14_0_10_36_16 TaxID=1974645 RepID=A0A2H0TYT5_9BACT|nr:MAG: ATP synthase F1 subunit epsilon [Candidatus Magasanikbacteria bacterium CG10_big_fil_rev_8_21_14_0_10_36_16]
MSTQTLKFIIITPEKKVYENEILQVTIPTTSGEITVLPGHIPLISVLQAGEMKIKDKDGEHPYAVSGGFLEVRSNSELVILADRAERADSIDIERAQEARQRAEEEMTKAKAGEDVDYARLQALIDKEMNRIRVGNKYRK